MQRKGNRRSDRAAELAAVRVLLIDDRSSRRAEVAEIVARDVAPVDVRKVEDHVGFFRALKDGDFDLVITEQRLHWSSGLEVVTAIKSLWPTVPVIMLASEADESIAAEVLQEGADAYIPRTGDYSTRLRTNLRSVLRRLEFEHRIDSLESRHRELLDGLNVGVFRATTEGDLLEANPALMRLIGYDNPKEAYGVRLASFLADPGVARELAERMAEDGQVRNFQVRIRRKDDSFVWASLNQTMHSLGGGDPIVEGIVEDVTAAREAHEALHQANADLRAIFEHNTAAIAVIQADGVVSMVNTAFERLSGFQRSEIEGVMNWTQFMALADAERATERRRVVLATPETGPRSGRFEFLTREKRALQVLTTEAALPGGGRSVISLINVTERERVEEQLLYNAFHDPLTGLPNRMSLFDRMTSLLSRAVSAEERRFTLILVALDRFRVINDSYGHRVGDLVLQAATRRIEGAVPGADTFARCSGDTFGVILHPTTDEDDGPTAADAISGVLSDPFRFGDQTVYSSASFGIVTSVRDRDSGDLFRKAETALYEAKRSGRHRWVRFEDCHEGAKRHAFPVEHDLRRALDAGEFELYYQPIAGLSDGALLGFEGLLRWNRAGGEQLEPGVFLPVAEESGIILEIGREAVRQACRQLVGWNASAVGHDGRCVGVNLGLRQLERSDTVVEIREAIRVSGVAPASVIIEVAEAVVAEGTETIDTVLRKLHEEGVTLCLDSFGTGVSALGRLYRLPFSLVKIDRSFLTGIGNDETRWNVYEGLVALTGRLGMEVIAEGIEDRSQLERLKRFGCRFGQGQLLSDPVEAAVAERMLAAHPVW